MWKLGRIERLVVSKDGRVHVAGIYLLGNRHVQHAINLFYPIKLYDGLENNLIKDSKAPLSSKHDGIPGHTKDRTNVRKAAQIVKETNGKLCFNVGRFSYHILVDL